MKYVSLFSGIEAASVAWSPLGWTPMAFAEVDPFCCSVLSHRYPGVPNLGDVTQVEIQPGTADVVVGGSPCQSFSVAGKRIGLDDPRGNLALVYIRVVRRSRARWMVYENVPGLLSSGKGDDFAAFLSALTGWDIPAPDGPWKNSGIIPQRTADDYGIAYRILDAQYSGVPQRRRRVFVVGCLGDWRGAAAVLFERHSLSGDPPPGREAGAVVAGTLASRTGAGGGLGTDFECDGGLIASTLRSKHNLAHDVTADTLILRVYRDSGSSNWREGVGTLTAHDAKDGYCSGLVTRTLRGDGFDASEDGTGRGTPLVPVQAYQCHGSNVGPMGTLRAGNGNEAGGVPFVACALQASDGGASPGYHPVVPYIVSSAHSCEVQSHAREADTARCLDQSGGFAANQGGTVVAYQWAVRRLTPLECERLQGFPDSWTLVPFRAKLAVDGPRYKAIGNSIAVPVIRWIGERIDMVEAIT